MKPFSKWRRNLAARRKRRTLEKQYDRVWNLYQQEIKAAKTSDERYSLGSLQLHECDEFSDELLEMDSADITRRAARCHMSLSDMPLLEGETSHWETGKYGARYIHPEALRKFTRAVETAEFERSERRWKLKDYWFKVFTAIAAAAASILNIFGIHKR